MDLLLGFLLAMSVTMALIPPLMQAAARLQFLDAPAIARCMRRRCRASAASRWRRARCWRWCCAGEFAQPMPAYLAGVLVLLLFGVWDDRASR